MGEKDEKNFDPLTPPPSRPLGAGPSICHSSLVTLGGGGPGGVWHKAMVLVCWRRLLASRHCVCVLCPEDPPSRCVGPPFLFLQHIKDPNGINLQFCAQHHSRGPGGGGGGHLKYTPAGDKRKKPHGPKDHSILGQKGHCGPASGPFSFATR